MPIYTDRSRILTYQRCKRERFLAYHCLNTGISLARLIIPLSTGIAIHDGVTSLLRLPFSYCPTCRYIDIDNKPNYCPVCKDRFLVSIKNVDDCVSLAIDNYTEECKKKKLEIGDNEDQSFVFNEQKALIEAMIRVYEKIQLPRILSEYEVLGVEKEITYNLIPETQSSKQIVQVGLEKIESEPIITKYPGIILMSKPDAILRDKSTKGIVIYSLKTSSSWTDTNEKQNKYDDQGISELIAVEDFLGEEVEAIKMDFLIKGQRQPLSDGMGGKVKLQNSFLIHPYMCDTGFTQEFRVDYTKAKGWRRINIWEEMPIKEWVDILVERFYESLDGGYDDLGNKKNGIIVTPYPYNRDEQDIENWLEQNRKQELDIVDSLIKLRSINPDLVGPREADKEYKKLVNEYFPQTRNSCYSYGRFCTFVEHCWEGLKVTAPEFEARTPHHETEIIKLKGLSE